MAVFWDVALCSLVEVYRHFTTYRPDDGGSKHLWNVGKLLPDYTAQHPRRHSFSYLPPWEPEILPNVIFFIVNIKLSFLKLCKLKFSSNGDKYKHRHTRICWCFMPPFSYRIKIVNLYHPRHLNFACSLHSAVPVLNTSFYAGFRKERAGEG
jgi:hypothetical protein